MIDVCDTATKKDMGKGLVISTPPSPKWRIWLTENTCWQSQTAPNRFQRWMQEIVFGIKWERLEDL